MSSSALVPVDGKRAWLTLGLVSALFFLVTAATFNALGPALHDMMGELHWSGSEAGAGFSLLGVFCGITSTVPAFLIRRIGIRLTLALGGVVMAAAFACLALTQGPVLYFAGCSLAGLGFTLLATVPGTYLLARGFERPAFIFGLYFTLGQGGAVAGPLLYLWIAAQGGWRAVWIVCGIAILAAALLAALLVDSRTDVAARSEQDPEITSETWSVRTALKTPQFAVLAAAYSVFLFVDITVAAFSIPHLTAHGVGETVAVGLLSLGAAINAGARLAGGVLSRFMDAKTLLSLALLLLAVGLLALCADGGGAMLMIYVTGIGIGSGLTFFASTILLLDYFGRKPNLELFATVNVISTIGSVGPAFAGLVFDRSGSFVPAFLALAVMVFLIMLAVLGDETAQGAAMKEFGVFLPVANGGWIVSSTTPTLDGGWAQNRDAALAAEAAGFDFAMAMGKWRGFGGATGHWDTSLEPVIMLAGIAALTSRIQLWATLHAILHNPVVAAKMIATLDRISNGRAGLNIVAGAYRGEFAQMGAWDESLGHDGRYDLAQEWTQIVKRLWSEDRVDFHGRYFDIADCVCEPKPLRPPRLICAGMSPRGFEFSVRETDGCFIGGRDQAETRIASLKAKDLAAKLGKAIRTYAMVTVIWDQDDGKAEAKAQHYRRGIDRDAVSNLLESYGARKSGEAGNALAARSQTAFMTQTAIGAPATVAQRIADFLGICELDGVMLIFDEYRSGVAMAGREILPRLRSALA